MNGAERPDGLDPEPRPGFGRLSARQKVVVALVLTSVIPALVLVYVYVAFIGGLPRDQRGFFHLLAASTEVLMVAGALVIWDLSREADRANRRWRELSLTDELTGTYNRRYCFQRLHQEIARATRYRHSLCLVLIDVDRFKEINDRHGHATGDAVLREVCRVIQSQSRVESALCRYVGDEFAVLLPETPATGAQIYAERIRATVERATFPHGGAVTISIGISAFPDDAANAEALFKGADASLYAAKAAGRNRIGS